MARNSNPYAGQYTPARMNMTKQDIEKGLKGIKIKAPNRKQSTQAYKSALPKVEGAFAGNG